MRIDVPVIITAVTLSILFVGSLLVYPLNPYSFDSEADFGDGSVTIYSSPATEYGVCAFDTIMNTDRNIYIFIDGRYASITGIGYQRSFAESLERELDLRNYRSGGLEVKRIDADELKDILNDTSNSEDGVIVFAGGALPVLADGSDPIGDTAGMISDWVDTGGVLLWAADKFGYYFAPMDTDYKEWLTDGDQPLGDGSSYFIGSSDLINPTMTKTYAGTRTEAADAMSVIHNEITNGVKASHADVSLGYVDGVYGSASFIHNATQSGGYLIFGGTIEDKQGLYEAEIAQILTSGLFGAKLSTMICEKGTMKGSKTVQLDLSGLSDPRIYVYAGFVASTYGKLHTA